MRHYHYLRLLFPCLHPAKLVSDNGPREAHRQRSRALNCQSQSLIFKIDIPEALLSLVNSDGSVGATQGKLTDGERIQPVCP